MPLPGAFAGHFCKVLSSHEEAFFRISAQCWAFVVVTFEFAFFFFKLSVGMGLCTGAFDKFKIPIFILIFFFIDHLYVKRHCSKLLDYYL